MNTHKGRGKGESAEEESAVGVGDNLHARPQTSQVFDGYRAILAPKVNGQGAGFRMEDILGDEPAGLARLDAASPGGFGESGEELRPLGSESGDVDDTSSTESDNSSSEEELETEEMGGSPGSNTGVVPEEVPVVCPEGGILPRGGEEERE